MLLSGDEENLIYSASFHYIQVGILLVQDEKILYANPCAAGMAGCQPEKMVGESIFDWVFPDSDQAFQQLIQGSIDTLENPIQGWFGSHNKNRIPVLLKGAWYPQESNSARIILTLTESEQKASDEALHRRVNELAVLNAVAIASTESNTEDDLIYKVTQIINSTLYPDEAGVLLVDPDQLVLVPHPSYQTNLEKPLDLRIPIGKGVTGSVVASGQSRCIPDISKVAEYIPPKNHRAGSELCVPLKVGEQILGVFNVESTQLDFFNESDESLLTTIAGQLATVISRFRTEANVRKQAEQLAAIYEVSQEIVGSSLEPEQVYQAIHRAVAQLMPCEAFVITLKEPDNPYIQAVYLVDKGGRYPPQRFPSNTGLSGAILARGKPIIIQEFKPEADPYNTSHFGDEEEVQSLIAVPVRSGDHIIGMLSTQSYQANAYKPEDVQLLELLTAYATIALENARLYEETRHYANRMRAVSDMGRSISEILEFEAIYHRLGQAISTLAPNASLLLVVIYDSIQQTLLCEYAQANKRSISKFSVTSRLLTSDQASVYQNILKNPKTIFLENHDQIEQASLLCIENHYISQEASYQSALIIPMIVKGGTLGFLEIRFGQAIDHTDLVRGNYIEMLTIIANTAAIAIENARLFLTEQHSLQRLKALNAIDMAVAASMDLRVTLNVILDQTIALLDLDAADILLFNTFSQMFEFACGRGFHTEAITRARLHLGQGLAGRAALERRMIHISDLAQAEEAISLVKTLSGEGFVAYSAFPLIAKGQIKGILEIFHRNPQPNHPDWKGFLETLAGQAAIAIDNATLLNDLQRSNLELTLAYDTTLEGWAHALEIRDKETEGHARRVVDLTIRLARAMGLNETDLVHIRRGVLLHDIGKMGIPDSILNKPGPLTAEERQIMNKHPDYAYQMLSNIAFLGPAIDIPYSHHEKWDGNGYPNGLKGDQIPLYARIFAVVDVWDSLVSDRPYRSAWSIEQTLEYIKAQSGAYFDPQILTIFLELEPWKDQS